MPSPVAQVAQHVAMPSSHRLPIWRTCSRTARKSVSRTLSATAALSTPAAASRLSLGARELSWCGQLSHGNFTLPSVQNQGIINASHEHSCSPLPVCPLESQQPLIFRLAIRSQQLVLFLHR